MSDAPSEDDPAPSNPSADEVTEATLAELHRVYGRIAASTATTVNIIQFIIVIFAAGILAAAEVPAAIASVPVFWSGWMLHSILTDYDTLKYSSYATELEIRLNAAIGQKIFRWESELAVRDHHRPMIYQFSYVYWGFLNIASWVMAFEVLRRTQSLAWALVLALVGLLVWTVTALSLIRRDKYRASLRKLVGGSSDSGPEASSVRASATIEASLVGGSSDSGPEAPYGSS